MPDVSFVGGLRWPPRIGGYANASVPLVRLRLTAGGLVIEPSNRMIAWYVPDWRLPWPDVERAERVGRVPFMTTGVRFFVHGRDKPFTFWTLRPEEVLEALERRGVAVDGTYHSINWLWGS